MHTSVEVDPPGFAPLIEWRYDGQPLGAPPASFSLVMDWSSEGMGATATRHFTLIGNHTIEVGPLMNPDQIEIETYSVTITSHISGEDIIPEGEPVVFIAETDPPGYEDEITWLSSTKYGTAVPILGEGPIFIAEFNDTWGPHPDGGNWQWLGVKGDTATAGQDQKTGCCTDTQPDGWAFETTLAGCDLMQGIFAGELITCLQLAAAQPDNLCVYRVSGTTLCPGCAGVCTVVAGSFGWNPLHTCNVTRTVADCPMAGVGFAHPKVPCTNGGQCQVTFFPVAAACN